MTLTKPTAETATHVVLRDIGGPIDGHIFRPGDLIDTTLWPQGRAEKFVDQRRLQVLPGRDLAAEAAAASTRAKRGLEELDLQEAAARDGIAAAADVIATNQKRLRELDRLVAERAEVEGRTKAAVAATEKHRAALAGIPATRRKFIAEKERGELLLRSAKVTA